MASPFPRAGPLNVRTQKLFHIALALTLVLAQFVAQAHGYTHLRLNGGAPAQPCSECLACSPLLAGSDAPVHAITFPHPAVEAISTFVDASVVERFRHRPFQSRAPPALS